MSTIRTTSTPGRRRVTTALAVVLAVVLAAVLVPLAGCAGPPGMPGRPGMASPTRTGAASTTPSPTPTGPAGTGPAPTTTPSPAASHPTPGPSGLPADLLGRDLTRIPTDRRVVALTFDAGGNADGVASILATLAAKGVPATFFLTGRWVQAYPASAAEVAAQAATRGHAIGNHTQTHPHFSTLTDAQKATEVATGAARIRAATGVDPRPLFRFPFGERTASDVRLLNARGYLCVGWTVDTLGWQGTSQGRSTDSVVARVLGGLQPGEIVLMHAGSHPTDRSTLDADALPRLVDELRARGYGFVTLAALTGAAAPTA